MLQYIQYKFVTAIGIEDLNIIFMEYTVGTKSAADFVFER